MQFERRNKVLSEWPRARLVLVMAVLVTFVALGAALVASQTAGRYEVKPEFTTFNPGDSRSIGERSPQWKFASFIQARPPGTGSFRLRRVLLTRARR